MQLLSEMLCLGICHMLSIIELLQMLPEYLMATGEVDWLKAALAAAVQNAIGNLCIS